MLDGSSSDPGDVMSQGIEGTRRISPGCLTKQFRAILVRPFVMYSKQDLWKRHLTYRALDGYDIMEPVRM